MTDDSPSRRRWTRLFWFLIPALVFLGAVTVATLRDAGPPRPGDEAPAFSAPLLSGGGELALADLAGEPVVLNFWASWCAPCEDEAPFLQRAHEEFGDRVSFVGVDIKDARSDALKFVETYKLTYPSVRDETGKIYSDYGLTGQPETFFIDASGQIYEHVQGPLFEEDLLVLLQLLCQLYKVIICVH